MLRKPTGFTNAYAIIAEARMARIPLVPMAGDAPSTGLRPFDIDQAKAAEAVGVLTLLAGPGNATAVADRAFDLALQNRPTRGGFHSLQPCHHPTIGTGTSVTLPFWTHWLALQLED